MVRYHGEPAGWQLSQRLANTLFTVNYALIYKELYWSDIMESRLGGSYLTDMQQLRDQHKNLKEIVDFFLAKASPVYVKSSCSSSRLKGPHCKENPIYVFPEEELRGLSPNSTFM